MRFVLPKYASHWSAFVSSCIRLKTNTGKQLWKLYSAPPPPPAGEPTDRRPFTGPKLKRLSRNMTPSAWIS
jgi:hypothetical protein